MIWPPTPLSISVVLGVVLLAYSAIRLGSKFFDDSRIFTYIYNAFVVGFITGNILVPVTWLTMSFILSGGTIEDNLYPGSSIESFLFWTFGMSLVISGVTLSRYLSGLRQSQSDDEG